MNPYERIRRSHDYRSLLEVSERLGRNPLQVQAAGGNTSLERDGAMWVKASGKWLADARRDDLFVPVDALAMRRAFAQGDPAARDADAFRVANVGPALRASIETSVHALLDWPVVLHTHCVSTLAVAVREDAEAVVRESLDGLDAVFIPYVKPGWDLAMAIRERATARTRVLVLGNHGLVACGGDAAEAEALVLQASQRLARAEPSGADVAPEFLDWLAPSTWRAVTNPAMQALVRDPVRLALVEGNSLYPDHIVFLGPGVALARDDEQPVAASMRAHKAGVPPKLVLFPGRGAALPPDAGEAAMALAECFGELMMRIDPAARLKRLSDEEEFAILDWDAEQHRRSLDKTRA